MPRESVRHLIERKQSLYAEKSKIDEELSALPPEHLWVVNKDPTEYPLELTLEEAKVKDSFIALNDRKLRVQAQLDRAERIAPRDTNGPAPTFCIDCFIDHENKPLMVEVESALRNGVRQFECPSCKRVLPVHPM